MKFFRPPALITRLVPQALWNIPNDQHQVFLTFDDGPDERFTPAILEILEQQSIVATFFVIGSKAKKNPALLRKMSNLGHQIGTHAFHHKRFILHSSATMRQEIGSSKEITEQIIGQPVRLFRPPHGLFSPAMLHICQQLDLKIVQWSYLTYDFDLSMADRFILNYANETIKTGEIIVMHDGHRHSFRTTRILPFFIQQLQSKGLKLASIQ